MRCEARTLRIFYEIGQAYDNSSLKKQIIIKRLFQVGLVVYQLAKLRMLEFHYDFLD